MRFTNVVLLYMVYTLHTCALFTHVAPGPGLWTRPLAMVVTVCNEQILSRKRSDMPNLNRLACL